MLLRRRRDERYVSDTHSIANRLLRRSGGLVLSAKNTWFRIIRTHTHSDGRLTTMSLISSLQKPARRVYTANNAQSSFHAPSAHSDGKYATTGWKPPNVFPPSQSPIEPLLMFLPLFLLLMLLLLQLLRRLVSILPKFLCL